MQTNSAEALNWTSAEFLPYTATILEAVPIEGKVV